MNDLQGLRVVVAGAGAVGTTTALTLVRRGAKVWLADPGEPQDNASAVAAGMLAPACETLLDPVSDHRFAIFTAARDAWADLIEAEPGLPPLDRSGALLRPQDAAALSRKAAAAGIVIEAADPAWVAARAPFIQNPEGFLYTPEDWRLDARLMLAALHDAVRQGGGVRLTAAVMGREGGRALFNGADPVRCDALVLATGAAGAGLTPIKGQILRFDRFGPATGAVVRGEGVYITPGAGGMIVGATMEEGRSDLQIDAEVVARLRASAARLAPALADARASAFAGIRGATADGLPVVGPADRDGVFVARGARRNGWLLAPLMARTIAACLVGHAAPAPVGEAFDPARFGSAPRS